MSAEEPRIKSSAAFLSFPILKAEDRRNSTIPDSEITTNPEEIWQCRTSNSGYLYDTERGDRKGKIPKEVRFEDLPDFWMCLICGVTKKCFRPLAGAFSTRESTMRAADSKLKKGVGLNWCPLLIAN
ncbi:MAG: rubredoxin [Syntrophobacteraceae bacterium]